MSRTSSETLVALAAAAVLATSVSGPALSQGQPVHVTGGSISLVGTPLPPPVAASTNGSGTVTVGGTYQTVFAQSSGRKGCLIQNPLTATEALSVRQAGSVVWTVGVGGSFSCAAGLVIVTDLIEVTAATTGHAFSAASQ